MRERILVLTWLLLAVPCRAEIIIVDDDGPADFNNIQAAIDDANNGDTVIVLLGLYSENINFLGKNIIVRSTDPTDANIVANTIIDGNDANSVVTFSGTESNSCILSGFTITNGRAHSGGGIRGNDTTATIQNNIISGNKAIGGDIPGAYGHGGGLSCCHGIIQNNTVSFNSAMIGGGLDCCGGTIQHNTIRDNSVGYLGGGLASCSGTIQYNIISRNSAGGHGGGLAYCSATVRNNTVSHNSAPSGVGGGLYECNSEIKSNTICGNYARNGGGGLSDCVGLIANCILWENSPDQIRNGLLVMYSNIQGGWPGSGNLDVDPCFADPCNGDYHLQPGSKCIDAGDPYLSAGPNDVDMDGQPRVMGGRVDIGADEFFTQMVAVTKPEGGEVWAGGSTHEIKWLSYGISGMVDVRYSSNNGAEWETIEDNVVNIGSYVWNLPNAVDSNECLVSIVPSVPDPNVVCINSGLFTIHPDLLHPEVPSKWKSLGGDFKRTGLSENYGPQLGCVRWQFEIDGAVSGSVTVGAKAKTRDKDDDDDDDDQDDDDNDDDDEDDDDDDNDDDDDDNDENDYYYRVHVACEDGRVYTLDINDGSLLWSYDTNSPLLSSPTIGPDGTVYVGSQNGKLYAIDIDGNLRWSHSTDGFIYSSPAVSEDGNIYVGSQDGTLYALGQDGSELWNFKIGGFGIIEGSILASPAIAADGTVYISGLYDPNLYALDPNDGSTKWVCNFASGGWPFASPVVAEDGTIYQTLLHDPNLYAIKPDEPNAGTIIWSAHLSKINFWFYEEFSYSEWFEPYYYEWGECIHPSLPFMYLEAKYNLSDSGWSEPALGPDGTIYVSLEDPYLRAVDPNGTIKWISKRGATSGYTETCGDFGCGWYEKSPGAMGGFTLTVGSDGLIYAGCDDGNLYVVDANGWDVARFDSNDHWLSFPVISEDNIVMVSDSRDNSMLISHPNNVVWAIGGNCEGQDLDLYWQGGAQDLDNNGVVDFNDLYILAGDWLKCTDCSNWLVCWPEVMFLTGDINRDKYVDFADFALLAERWLGGY